MPRQIIDFSPTGKLNRRDPMDEMDPSEVVSRENFLVTGIGKTKVNKKIAGSSRFSKTDLIESLTWLARHYSGTDLRATFGFEDGNLQFFDELGVNTVKVSALQPDAYPDSEQFKLSGNNVTFFVDGFNGMYSYDGNEGHDWKKETEVTLNFVKIVSHLDRMFGFEENSDNLHVSANLKPTNYTDATDSVTITIGAQRGSKIQNIFLWNEVLYIVKEDSMWVLEGRTPAAFRVRQITGVTGTPARHSVATDTRGGSGVYYMNQEYEFGVFDGFTFQILSYNFALGGDHTKDLNPIINKNEAALDRAYGVFHNFLYRCAFTEDGDTSNKLEYIYNTTNKSDGLTRGNNVSTYMVQDRVPDKQELFTGRSDNGFIMRQYTGLNWDNDASSPTMPLKLETASIGKNIRNKRFVRVWTDFQVLGAEPLRLYYWLDTRNANSTRADESFTVTGESIALTNFVNILSQTNVTSRNVLKWDSARAQSIRFIIDQDRADVDLSLSAIHLEVIVKTKKRNEKVGV